MDKLLRFSSLRFPHTRVLASVAIGVIPIAIFHLWTLLLEPHYQFLILLPFVIGFLVHREYQEGLRISSPSAVPAFILMALLVPLLWAAWVFSPWVFLASVHLAIPLALYAMGGRSLCCQFLPIWLLSAFFLGLPLSLDESLIIRLRNHATDYSSRLLDWFGTYHDPSGNVIEVPTQTLFVADACSGIHSLFVSLCFAFCLALFHRRSWFRTLVILLGTILLVMIENVTRITAIAYLLGFGIDLSIGWPHWLFGLLLFAALMGLIVSLDQMQNSISFFRRSKNQSDVAGQKSSRELKPLPWPMIVFSVCLIFTLPLSLYNIFLRANTIAASFAPLRPVPMFRQESLPQELGGFQMDRFAVVERVPDDPFGKTSQVWAYRAPNCSVQVSLDYPYRTLHDLCTCYRNTGWKVTNEQIDAKDDGQDLFMVPAGTPLDEIPILTATLSNVAHGSGVLLYSSLGSEGDAGVVIDSRKLANQQSITRRFGSGVSTTLTSPSYIQLQMVVINPNPISEENREEYVKLYREIRSILFSECNREFSK